jgi:hypothetical protein
LTASHSLAIVSITLESTFFSFLNFFSMGKRHLWPFLACTVIVAGKFYAPNGRNQPTRQVNKEQVQTSSKSNFQETA